MRRLFSQRNLYRGFYYVTWSLGSTVFFTALVRYVMAFQLEQLAVLCLPFLAVFFGFSALIYNRARALSSGSEQRRSLYAAERGMQATIFYLFGVVLAVIIASILWAFGARPIPFDSTVKNEYLLPFVIPLLLMLWAYGSFFFALRAISHRLFRRVLPKEILRRAK